MCFTIFFLTITSYCLGMLCLSNTLFLWPSISWAYLYVPHWVWVLRLKFLLFGMKSNVWNWSVMVNLDYQLDATWNQLRDIPLDESIGAFLIRITCGEDPLPGRVAHSGPCIKRSEKEKPFCFPARLHFLLVSASIFVAAAATAAVAAAILCWWKTPGGTESQ